MDGSRVKRLREAKGMTQFDLAARSGVSLRAIQYIERGRSNVRESTLLRLAEALEVSPAELMKV